MGLEGAAGLKLFSAESSCPDAHRCVRLEGATGLKLNVSSKKAVPQKLQQPERGYWLETRYWSSDCERRSSHESVREPLT